MSQIDLFKAPAPSMRPGHSFLRFIVECGGEVDWPTYAKWHDTQKPTAEWAVHNLERTGHLEAVRVDRITPNGLFRDDRDGWRITEKGRAHLVKLDARRRNAFGVDDDRVKKEETSR